MIERPSTPSTSATNQAWQLETGRGAGQWASTSDVLRAFSDPGFSAVAQRNRGLAATVSNASANPTRDQLMAFDTVVHAVPGALDAFERAIERVAPHLARGY